MPLIVNLSALHALYPTSTCIQSFEEVCDRYSTGYFRQCSSLFQSWTNYAWLMYQMARHNSKLIQPYRLGQLSSEEFLEKLVHIFYFLKDSSPKKGEMEHLNSKSLYSKTFAKMLLENAWNSQIEWDQSKEKYLSMLIEDRAKNTSNRDTAVASSEREPTRDPIYLIANTNELHVIQILHLLRKNNPSILFYRNIDVSPKDDKSPIEIAPGIFLCLSYRYQMFKTLEENMATDPIAKTSLLSYLVSKQLSEVPTSEIRFISQHQPDLVEALRIGIDPDNIYPADNYFTAQAEHFKKMH
ncbi:Uncharacterised protein [Legionella wadsworthii]|uniref:Uncharacterized protein n=1 Tax=Legionella wadsworthii TaxID=28088 RepID=A0A378LNT4_9GAMM|nr:hypothetical protein [Legionella wadsworthii]STY28586.1 Uncharacterised protein [Legionella wadsworthii]